MKLRPFAVVIVVLILSRSYSFGQSAKEVTNSIDAKFVLIPQGKFTMGAADTEAFGLIFQLIIAEKIYACGQCYR